MFSHMFWFVYVFLDIYSLTQVRDDDANYVAIDSAFFCDDGNIA